MRSYVVTVVATPQGAPFRRSGLREHRSPSLRLVLMAQLTALSLNQGTDTPIPVPVPVPDLSGDGDGAPVRVPDLPGGGDAPPSPSPICPESGTLPLPRPRFAGDGDAPPSPIPIGVSVPCPQRQCSRQRGKVARFGLVLSQGTHRGRPRVPSRSEARQATPRRFHSGRRAMGLVTVAAVRLGSNSPMRAVASGCSRAPICMARVCFAHYNSGRGVAHLIDQTELGPSRAGGRWC
jgi:hypothetical protein